VAHARRPCLAGTAASSGYRVWCLRHQLSCSLPGYQHSAAPSGGVDSWHSSYRGLPLNWCQFHPPLRSPIPPSILANDRKWAGEGGVPPTFPRNLFSGSDRSRNLSQNSSSHYDAVSRAAGGPDAARLPHPLDARAARLDTTARRAASCNHVSRKLGAVHQRLSPEARSSTAPSKCRG